MKFLILSLMAFTSFEAFSKPKHASTKAHDTRAFTQMNTELNLQTLNRRVNNIQRGLARLEHQMAKMTILKEEHDTFIKNISAARIGSPWQGVGIGIPAKKTREGSQQRKTREGEPTKKNR